MLYPSFLKSENNTSIFTGVTQMRLSGDSIFFNASIGIFLIFACSLYLSENGYISSAFPITCMLLSLPNPSYLSKIAKHTFSFFSRPINFSPPSENIQNLSFDNCTQSAYILHYRQFLLQAHRYC